MTVSQKSTLNRCLNFKCFTVEVSKVTVHFMLYLELTRDHTVLPATHAFMHKWNEHVRDDPPVT